LPIHIESTYLLKFADIFRQNPTFWGNDHYFFIKFGRIPPFSDLFGLDGGEFALQAGG